MLVSAHLQRKSGSLFIGKGDPCFQVVGHAREPYIDLVPVI